MTIICHRASGFINPDAAVEYLTVRATAKALGVHENTIRNWCNSGHLASKELPSGFRRIPKTEVARLNALAASRGLTPLADIPEND